MPGDGTQAVTTEGHPSALRGKAQDLHLARPWVTGEYRLLLQSDAGG